MSKKKFDTASFLWYIEVSMIENLSKVEYASLSKMTFTANCWTSKQERTANLYHEDNLSLAEIAEDLG